MAYATQSDLTALYGTTEVTRCSDWDLTGLIQPANITAALAAASDEMDSYLAVRYQLPLTSPPDDLVRRCAEMGMYYLCPFATTMTELKAKRYADNVAWLKSLADGKVTLGPDQNGETPAVVTDIEFVSTLPSIFSRPSPFPGDALVHDAMRKIL